MITFTLCLPQLPNVWVRVCRYACVWRLDDNVTCQSSVPVQLAFRYEVFNPSKAQGVDQASSSVSPTDLCMSASRVLGLEIYATGPSF